MLYRTVEKESAAQGNGEEINCAGQSRMFARGKEKSVWNSGKRGTSTMGEKNTNAAENTEFVDVSVEA